MVDKKNTSVVIPNKRKVTSIYVDPLIWKSFLRKCRVSGTSTCSVLESFMYAFSKAVPDTPIAALPNVVVNLTINRVVQRVKRQRRSYVKDNYHGSMRNTIRYRDGSWEYL